MNMLLGTLKKPLLAGILSILCTVAFATPYNKEKSDYVLIINSYSESNPWSRMFTTPVYERLNMDDENITAYTEHLNMLIVDTEEEVDEFAELILRKYAEKPPMLVVFLGNSSYVLLRDQLESRWGDDIPFLLCVEKDYIGPRECYIRKEAFTESQRQLLSDIVRTRENLTVIYAPEFVKETVSLIKNCIPDMNRLIFLSDQRYISLQNQETVKKDIAKYFPEIELELVTTENYGTEELIDILQNADKQTGILYYSWSLALKLGKNEVISADTYHMLSSYTALPIFTLNDMDITENGMVGGYFYPEENVTATMAKTIDELLKGKVYTTIIMPEGPRPVMSYPVVLAKKDVTFSMCPPDTLFYMKPPTFWEQYRFYVVIACAVIGFCMLLLTFRINTLTKKRQFQDRELKLMSSYSRLINNMPITYLKQRVIFNESGRAVDYIMLTTNSEFERRLFPMNQALGKKGTEVHDGQLTEYLNACTLVLKQNKKVTSHYYNKPTDRYFSVIMVSAQEEDCVDVFLVDTTELQKTQQQLRTVNNKLAMSLDVANIVPWRWDLEKKVILCDVNKPVELGLGNDEENQLTVPDSQYFARIKKEDRKKVEQAYAELINGTVGKITEEYRVYNREKGLHYFDWVEARAAVDKRDEYGRPVSLIGSSLVITERKKIEQELIQAKNKAEESNRLKSAFLANMSHEIRTPLNAIVGFSNILATTEAEDEKEEYVSIIENNNTLLLQLISDILDLSKIEAGTLEFAYEDVDINLLFRELEQSMQLRAKESVRVVYEQSGECFAAVPKNRLMQVMTNLMTNAVKFTDTGSIRFGYSFRDDKRLSFYVADTGCGIPAEQQERVFERFVKLDAFAQGTGLGLSICRMIVCALGGEISIESEVGRGSTFRFTFPYHPAERVVTKVPEFEKKKVEQNRLVVLIAEDNSGNFKLFESILSREYRIIHAWNGREAVELFKEYEPHIVLMDINMPEMNGYEATEEIRKISKDVPIMAVTAYAFASDEQRILQSGFDAYTSKPLNASQLKKQMIDLLGKRLFLV